MAAAELALDASPAPVSRRHSESFAPDPSLGDGIEDPLPRAASVP